MRPNATAARLLLSADDFTSEQHQDGHAPRSGNAGITAPREVHGTSGVGVHARDFSADSSDGSQLPRITRPTTPSSTVGDGASNARRSSMRNGNVRSPNTDFHLMFVDNQAAHQRSEAILHDAAEAAAGHTPIAHPTAQMPTREEALDRIRALSRAGSFMGNVQYSGDIFGSQGDYSEGRMYLARRRSFTGSQPSGSPRSPLAAAAAASAQSATASSSSSSSAAAGSAVSASPGSPLARGVPINMLQSAHELQQDQHRQHVGTTAAHSLHEHSASSGSGAARQPLSDAPLHHDQHQHQHQQQHPQSHPPRHPGGGTHGTSSDSASSSSAAALHREHSKRGHDHPQHHAASQRHLQQHQQQQRNSRHSIHESTGDSRDSNRDVNNSSAFVLEKLKSAEEVGGAKLLNGEFYHPSDTISAHVRKALGLKTKKQPLLGEGGPDHASAAAGGLFPASHHSDDSTLSSILSTAGMIHEEGNRGAYGGNIGGCHGVQGYLPVSADAGPSSASASVSARGTPSPAELDNPLVVRRYLPPANPRMLMPAKPITTIVLGDGRTLTGREAEAAALRMASANQEVLTVLPTGLSSAPGGTQHHRSHRHSVVGHNSQPHSGTSASTGRDSYSSAGTAIDAFDASVTDRNAGVPGGHALPASRAASAAPSRVHTPSGTSSSSAAAMATAANGGITDAKQLLALQKKTRAMAAARRGSLETGVQYSVDAPSWFTDITASGKVIKRMHLHPFLGIDVSVHRISPEPEVRAKAGVGKAGGGRRRSIIAQSNVGEQGVLSAWSSGAAAHDGPTGAGGASSSSGVAASSAPLSPNSLKRHKAKHSLSINPRVSIAAASGTDEESQEQIQEFHLKALVEDLKGDRGAIGSSSTSGTKPGTALTGASRGYAAGAPFSPSESGNFNGNGGSSQSPAPQLEATRQQSNADAALAARFWWDALVNDNAAAAGGGRDQTVDQSHHSHQQRTDSQSPSSAAGHHSLLELSINNPQKASDAELQQHRHDEGDQTQSSNGSPGSSPSSDGDDENDEGGDDGKDAQPHSQRETAPAGLETSTSADGEQSQEVDGDTDDTPKQLPYTPIPGSAFSRPNSRAAASRPISRGLFAAGSFSNGGSAGGSTATDANSGGGGHSPLAASRPVTSQQLQRLGMASRGSAGTSSSPFPHQRGGDITIYNFTTASMGGDNNGGRSGTQSRGSARGLSRGGMGVGMGGNTGGLGIGQMPVGPPVDDSPTSGSASQPQPHSRAVVPRLQSPSTAAIGGIGPQSSVSSIGSYGSTGGASASSPASNLHGNRSQEVASRGAKSRRAASRERSFLQPEAIETVIFKRQPSLIATEHARAAEALRNAKTSGLPTAEPRERRQSAFDRLHAAASTPVQQAHAHQRAASKEKRRSQSPPQQQKTRSDAAVPAGTTTGGTGSSSRPSTKAQVNRHSRTEAVTGIIVSRPHPVVPFRGSNKYTNISAQPVRDFIDGDDDDDGENGNDNDRNGYGGVRPRASTAGGGGGGMRPKRVLTADEQAALNQRLTTPALIANRHRAKPATADAGTGAVDEQPSLANPSVISNGQVSDLPSRSSSVLGRSQSPPFAINSMTINTRGSTAPTPVPAGLTQSSVFSTGSGVSVATSSIYQQSSTFSSNSGAVAAGGYYASRASSSLGSHAPSSNGTAGVTSASLFSLPSPGGVVPGPGLPPGLPFALPGSRLASALASPISLPAGTSFFDTQPTIGADGHPVAATLQPFARLSDAFQAKLAEISRSLMSTPVGSASAHVASLFAAAAASSTASSAQQNGSSTAGTGAYGTPLRPGQVSNPYSPHTSGSAGAVGVSYGTYGVPAVATTMQSAISPHTAAAAAAAMSSAGSAPNSLYSTPARYSAAAAAQGSAVNAGTGAGAVTLAPAPVIGFDPSELASPTAPTASGGASAAAPASPFALLSTTSSAAASALATPYGMSSANSPTMIAISSNGVVTTTATDTPAGPPAHQHPQIHLQPRSASSSIPTSPDQLALEAYSRMMLNGFKGIADRYLAGRSASGLSSTAASASGPAAASMPGSRSASVVPSMTDAGSGAAPHPGQASVVGQGQPRSLQALGSGLVQQGAGRGSIVATSTSAQAAAGGTSASTLNSMSNTKDGIAQPSLPSGIAIGPTSTLYAASSTAAIAAATAAISPYQSIQGLPEDVLRVYSRGGPRSPRGNGASGAGTGAGSRSPRAGGRRPQQQQQRTSGSPPSRRGTRRPQQQQQQQLPELRVGTAHAHLSRSQSRDHTGNRGQGSRGFNGPVLRRETSNSTDGSNDISDPFDGGLMTMQSQGGNERHGRSAKEHRSRSRSRDDSHNNRHNDNPYASLRGGRSAAGGLGLTIASSSSALSASSSMHRESTRDTSHSNSSNNGMDSSQKQRVYTQLLPSSPFTASPSLVPLGSAGSIQASIAAGRDTGTVLFPAATGTPSKLGITGNGDDSVNHNGDPTPGQLRLRTPRPRATDGMHSIDDDMDEGVLLGSVLSPGGYNFAAHHGGPRMHQRHAPGSVGLDRREVGSRGRSTTKSQGGSRLAAAGMTVLSSGSSSGVADAGVESSSVHRSSTATKPFRAGGNISGSPPRGEVHHVHRLGHEPAVGKDASPFLSYKPLSGARSGLEGLLSRSIDDVTAFYQRAGELVADARRQREIQDRVTPQKVIRSRSNSLVASASHPRQIIPPEGTGTTPIHSNRTSGRNSPVHSDARDVTPGAKAAPAPAIGGDVPGSVPGTSEKVPGHVQVTGLVARPVYMLSAHQQTGSSSSNSSSRNLNQATATAATRDRDRSMTLTSSNNYRGSPSGRAPTANGNGRGTSPAPRQLSPQPAAASPSAAGQGSPSAAAAAMAVGAAGLSVQTMGSGSVTGSFRFAPVPGAQPSLAQPIVTGVPKGSSGMNMNGHGHVHAEEQQSISHAPATLMNSPAASFNRSRVQKRAASPPQRQSTAIPSSQQQQQHQQQQQYPQLNPMPQYGSSTGGISSGSGSSYGAGLGPQSSIASGLGSDFGMSSISSMATISTTILNITAGHRSGHHYAPTSAEVNADLQQASILAEQVLAAAGVNREPSSAAKQQTTMRRSNITRSGPRAQLRSRAGAGSTTKAGTRSASNDGTTTATEDADLNGAGDDDMQHLEDRVDSDRVAILQYPTPTSRQQADAHEMATQLQRKIDIVRGPSRRRLDAEGLHDTHQQHLTASASAAIHDPDGSHAAEAGVPAAADADARADSSSGRPTAAPSIATSTGAVDDDASAAARPRTSPLAGQQHQHHPSRLSSSPSASPRNNGTRPNTSPAHGQALAGALSGNVAPVNLGGSGSAGIARQNPYASLVGSGISTLISTSSAAAATTTPRKAGAERAIDASNNRQEPGSQNEESQTQQPQQRQSRSSQGSRRSREVEQAGTESLHTEAATKQVRPSTVPISPLASSSSLTDRGRSPAGRSPRSTAAAAGGLVASSASLGPLASGSGGAAPTVATSSPLQQPASSLPADLQLEAPPNPIRPAATLARIGFR